MSLVESLNNFGRAAEAISLSQVERVLGLMPRALQVGGFFPTSSDMSLAVQRELANPRVSAESLAQIIRSDPVTMLRVISLSNGARYSRGVAVDQLPTAITQLGLMQLGATIDDLAERKPLAECLLGRSGCQRALHQYVVTLICATALASTLSPTPNVVGLVASAAALAAMPSLMMGYLRPNIAAMLWHSYGLSASAREAGCTGLDAALRYERNFKRVMQKTVSAVAADIGATLSIPRSIINIVQLAELAPWNRRSWGSGDGREVRAAVTALYIAHRLASEIFSFCSPEHFVSELKELSRKSQIRENDLKSVLAQVLDEYAERLTHLGIPGTRLPELLSTFGREFGTSDGNPPESRYTVPSIATRLNPFLVELKTCFRAGVEDGEASRLSQVIGVTLHALVCGVGFDRALFLRNDGSKLSLFPEACFGEEIGDALVGGRPILLERADTLPEVQALLLRRVVFTGDPLFPSSWPFVAFPAISDGEVVGVFYADMRERAEPTPLDVQEQVACVAIAEEWRHAPRTL